MPCQLHGCQRPLVTAYAKKCKVCVEHMKDLQVLIDGSEHRFCQKCSRFHPVLNFDANRRSCRRSLYEHNEKQKAAREMRRANGGIEKKPLERGFSFRQVESSSPHFMHDVLPPYSAVPSPVEQVFTPVQQPTPLTMQLQRSYSDPFTSLMMAAQGYYQQRPPLVPLVSTAVPLPFRPTIPQFAVPYQGPAPQASAPNANQGVAEVTALAKMVQALQDLQQNQNYSELPRVPDGVSSGIWLKLLEQRLDELGSGGALAGGSTGDANPNP